MYRNISIRNAPIFIILSLFLLTSPQAFAGYLTIKGTSSIAARLEGDKVNVRGSYSISNAGNELAQNVFPSMQIGKWTWAGEPKNIAANANQSWDINSSFGIELLASEEQDLGAGQQLPAKGQFPLIIRRHYEDLNGRPFSTADIQGITVGNLSSEELSAIRIPQINAQYKCEGDGKSFSCLLSIRNLSDVSKKISVAYYTSQELQLQTAQIVLDLQARAQSYQESKIENFSGLPGSGYAVFAVIQWAESGVRKYNSAVEIVNIKEPDNSHWIIWGGIGVFILSVLLLYLFVFRTHANRVGAGKRNP